uniref:Uncharacterized protein n=1 Tax=Rhizophora mucronata TaxID=61149 RepID=A0A2P2NP14_RHIMU
MLEYLPMLFSCSSCKLENYWGILHQHIVLPRKPRFTSACIVAWF